MDFPLQKAIVESLTENESWDKGLVKIVRGTQTNDTEIWRPLRPYDIWR